MPNRSRDRPNIIYLVMDACRYDRAKRHATTLGKVASKNVSFEETIAPSPWSLPSHASMFSGTYPAEHGVARANDALSCPTAEMLSEMGYTSVGISANGFASQRTGFDDSFDEFYYTGGRDYFADGLDVSGTAQRMMRDDDISTKNALYRLLKRIPPHDHPIKSLVNLLAVGFGETALSVEPLQRIPHPWFAPDSGYCYDPSRNTDRLLEVLGRDDGPYFVFLNYMDTHRPYKPNAGRQRANLGRTLSPRELRRLNETVASPRKFLELVENERLDEVDIDVVSGLYNGEIETVDAELERIVDYLDRSEAFEDTLLVVTSDHGENLGEIDDMGRRRMGHEGSVSDAVLEVPLVIANPNLDARTVDKRVSLKDVHHLLVDGMERFLESGGDDIGPMASDEDLVWSHYPAVGGEYLFEKYPGAPEEALAQRVRWDEVVVYRDEWKLVASSSGERWARRGDDVVEYEASPESLRSNCESKLSELANDGRGANLSDEEISQLEALGYM